MMPYEPARDIMRRTLANLEFVERHKGDRGPYEVTQLINSFLGAVAHPWETFKPDLKTIPFAVNDDWPSLSGDAKTTHRPENLGDALRLVRNGIAHGNIRFKEDYRGQIAALELWNINRDGKRDWGTVLSVKELRDVIFRFAALAESLAADDIARRQERA